MALLAGIFGPLLHAAEQATEDNRSQNGRKLSEDDPIRSHTELASQDTSDGSPDRSEPSSKSNAAPLSDIRPPSPWTIHSSPPIGEPSTAETAEIVQAGGGASNKHTARWRIFTNQGREMFSQGRLVEAERYLSRALEEARLGFGEEDPHVASSCNNLAELYRMSGQWHSAEVLFLEAAERLKQCQLPAAAAHALHNLAGLHLRRGQLGEARGYYQEALQLKEQHLGPDNPDTANTMFHLAEVFRRLGQHHEAEALLRASIQSLEAGGGSSNSMQVARRLMLLADMLVRSTDLTEEPLTASREGSAPVRHDSDGGSSSSSSTSTGSSLLHEAELLQRRAIQTLELAQSPDSLPVVSLRGSLASTLAARGKLEEAVDVLQRCAEVRISALGKDHIMVASSLQQYGSTLLQLARRRAAATASAGRAETEIRGAVAALSAAAVIPAGAGGTVGVRAGGGRAVEAERGNSATTTPAIASSGNESESRLDGESASWRADGGLELNTATAAELRSEALMALERAVRIAEHHWGLVSRMHHAVPRDGRSGGEERDGSSSGADGGGGWSSNSGDKGSNEGSGSRGNGRRGQLPVKSSLPPPPMVLALLVRSLVGLAQAARELVGHFPHNVTALLQQELYALHRVAKLLEEAETKGSPVQAAVRRVAETAKARLTELERETGSAT